MSVDPSAARGDEILAGPRAAASPFSIGAPGRAAREVPAGPPGAPSGHADVELSAATWAGVLIRGATCRGLHHRALGEPRQDAFAIGHRSCPEGGDWVIAAVCDGVGSLRQSDAAATLASRRLVDLAAAGKPWPEGFAHVNEEIRAAAEEVLRGRGGAEPGAGMATTAVAARVRREEGDWVGEVAWIGDSTLWHLDAGSRWTLISGLDCGDDGDDEYSWSRVRPMPSADGTCASREFRLAGGALFLMTDGVANPLRWSDDVQAALAGWWAAPPDPFTFAAQVAFARRTHIDDRTVVGLWPDKGDLE